MAKIVSYSKKSLIECAEFLRSGKLVSFPTETVYGLGASLWDKEAILNIFKAKERPMTDPLIVHLAKYSDCKNLTNLNEFQKKCFEKLAKKFWPGPLTMVVSASVIVPRTVTAGGDYVGIRIPSNVIARKLLKLCELPIVAPSANKFGHVSPTSAQHVFNDLKNTSDLLIIEDNTECDIGIESTVIKIEKEGTIKLLRPGAAQLSGIAEELTKHGISYILCDKKKDVSSNVSRETFSKTNIISRPRAEGSSGEVPSSLGDEAPGQNLTHYSPWIDTYIFIEDQKNIQNDFPMQSMHEFSFSEIKSAAILDFGKKYTHLKQWALFYADLSESENYAEAAHNLFRMLREAEQIKHANTILIAHIFLQTEKSSALYDRIYRAASGKFAMINTNVSRETFMKNS